MISVNIQKKIFSSGGMRLLDLELSLVKGSFTTICGKSGAGKTTLLKMLAGLVIPDNGKIVADGVVWYDGKAGISVKPQKRKAGLVFQDYALFHTMSVRENISFVCGGNVQKGWVDHLLEMVKLQDLAGRNPASLSGGQQQRLALARALAIRPSLLLLDEPFSALDRETKESLRQELLKIHRENNLTTIMVTHAVDEAALYGGQIYELDDTRLVLKKQGPENVKTYFTKAARKGSMVVITIQVNGRYIEVEVPEAALAGMEIQEESFVPTGDAASP